MAKKDQAKTEGWSTRNDNLKTFKTSGKHGWMHLVIGQDKKTKRKFLRLKRYMNWFSIPNSGYLLMLQRMIEKGAKELDWHIPKEKIKITEIEEGAAEPESPSDVPDDVVAFMEQYPDFCKKIIQLDIKNAELNYLFDLLGAIDEILVSSGERFKVAFKEVIQKVGKSKSDHVNEFANLLEKWDLHQIAGVSNILKTRLSTIETFEELITKEDTYEIKTDHSIHRILEKNMWLLDENYWIVQSNKTLRTFIGEEMIKEDRKYASKRPDFACVDHENKLLIVEIKRPSIELKKEELDQAELYHRIIKKYRSGKHKKIEVILIGNKISEEANDLIELRKGVEIKTYNDLLQNCKKRYGDYLKTLET